MNHIKKIVFLLLITACFCCNTKGQSSKVDQKITLTNFKVDETDNQLLISWTTDGTVATNYWRVQSSADGRNFSTFAIVLGPDPRQQGDSYQYKGHKISRKQGKLYYRLCAVVSDEKEIINEIIAQAK
ncbi:MAG TPA: hypothetical protein VK489_15575 [Ferruginibacter sp.]|nr:hypothetical protein [Ferruginibacter sp.]